MAATAARRAASVLTEWVDHQHYRVRPSQRTPTQISCRICFAFYGRMSTEDYQDYATSRTWQRNAADELIADNGVIVVEFFDRGQSRRVECSDPNPRVSG